MMNPLERAWQQPLEELSAEAADALSGIVPSVREWIGMVRPIDGTPGRLRWAIETTRQANVAATAYALGGLERMGVLDDVWSAEDRRAGAEWIRSMHIGNEQYRDPALMERTTPNWPEDEPWPSPAMLGGINQYARKVLSLCVDDVEELPPDNPPPGWPQPGDSPNTMLEWVKTRPYDKNAWGACSHGMRMARYMLRWHKEGRIPLAPVVEAVRFFFSIQDPETGLWGTPNQRKNVRINGTFKLFPLIREMLDLPLPHADKIIRQVLDEFAREDYDKTVGACDEWDNWYVIALAKPHASEVSQESIAKTAAWRISRVLSVFRQDDGGLSFFPHSCNTSWIGFDMAPALPQGDVMGIGILSAGINVCIDLAELSDATSWTGVWRMQQPEQAELREAFRRKLNL
jgi:hypothetical protein